MAIVVHCMNGVFTRCYALLLPLILLRDMEFMTNARKTVPLTALFRLNPTVPVAFTGSGPTIPDDKSRYMHPSRRVQFALQR